ncbi:restriction endonuclease subunit S [Rhizobium sp. 007]|uniref:restriction endonuclease subunit S n=1 Tax=Rhizobium sp. 007 TaxID=2785056 RepID=UPI00188DFD23|nr:restriction endonuclease subunit S [Rhizobium sp. 007]QPB24203.1 restriction endonuclease subunit S [Rhizobium sp. 007]
MNNPTFRDFRVKDLFLIERGQTKYIRRYYQENPGVYPVYSASTFEESIAGWIDSYDFDQECLTWTTNGYAGHVFSRSGRFSATRDVGILIARPDIADRLFLSYFVPALTTAFRAAAIGRFKEKGEADYTKLATRMAADVFVSVPVDNNGKPDLEAQREIADRFEVVARAQKKLMAMADHLKSLNITYPHIEAPTAEFPVSELFEKPSRGNGQLTQAYIRSHPGPYPVFSGSSVREEVAGYIDTFSFEGPCITWAADGYAGHAFEREGRFNANSHCGILRLRDEFRDLVYLPYVEVFLTPILLDIAVGRYRDDGSPDYTRVTTEMVEHCRLLLPTNDEGEPDIARQRIIADRMVRLHQGKERIVRLLQYHSKMKVNVAGLEAA